MGTMKRLGRALDKILQDIHRGVKDGFDKLLYG